MRTRMMLLIAALALLMLSLPTLSAQDANAQSAKVLALAMNPRMTPEPAFQDFLDGFKLAHEAGVNGNAFTEKWSVLESSAGNFQFGDYFTGMNGYEAVYPDTLMLGIQVINTTARETPADLLDVPFDDPRMLARFNTLIDAILPQISPHVRYLSIGNEVDVYLANHNEWDAYKTFYDGAVAQLHQAAPELQVGVTVTYSGLLQYTAEVMRLNENSDVFFLTYYPLGEFFMANDPAAPLKDFPNMVALSGNRPVILQEVGYPGADLLNSSEAEQAEFVRNVFAAWKAAGDAIPFLDFFLMHDLTDDFCSSLETYYGIAHPNFHAYLCTLGLRRADGTPKLAWDTFVAEAQAWKAGG